MLQQRPTAGGKGGTEPANFAFQGVVQQDWPVTLLCFSLGPKRKSVRRVQHGKEWGRKSKFGSCFRWCGEKLACFLVVSRRLIFPQVFNLTFRGPQLTTSAEDKRHAIFCGTWLAGFVPLRESGTASVCILGIP